MQMPRSCQQFFKANVAIDCLLSELDKSHSVQFPKRPNESNFHRTVTESLFEDSPARHSMNINQRSLLNPALSLNNIINIQQLTE